MGKIARVNARRLAYDQMKAERKQYIYQIIIIQTKQLTENDINHFMKNIDKNNTSYFGLVVKTNKSRHHLCMSPLKSYCCNMLV